MALHSDIEEGLKEAALLNMKAKIMILCIEGRCEYEMRVMNQIQDFPLKLGWMVHMPYNSPCERRKSVAKDLLALSAEHGQRDGLSYNLALLFQHDLTIARDTGTIRPDLFELLRCVFRMIHPGTQEIEGINSLVKHITDLAPSIGVRLLTSRIVSNNSLPHFNTPALREQLVQEFVVMHAEVQKFVNDADKAAKAMAVGPSESGVAAQPAHLVQPVQPEPVAERPQPQPAPALSQSKNVWPRC